MKLLADNPLGVAMSAVCGVLLLVLAFFSIIWDQPVSSGVGAQVPEDFSAAGGVSDIGELEPISAFAEVTDRPVFNESRKPAISSADTVENGTGGDDEVSDAPDVKLMGVFISPDIQLATMRPVSGGDSLIIEEGERLGSDYPGWAVVDVTPRQVVLASLEGGRLELELSVNDKRIKEPPKPVAKTALAAEGEDVRQDEALDDEGGEGQPLTRAEEIRQRIAERREELRRQAEQESENNPGGGSAEPSAYQNAMRNMIQKSRQKNSAKDESDETGGDGSDK